MHDLCVIAVMHMEKELYQGAVEVRRRNDVLQAGVGVGELGALTAEQLIACRSPCRRSTMTSRSEARAQTLAGHEHNATTTLPVGGL